MIELVQTNVRSAEDADRLVARLLNLKQRTTEAAAPLVPIEDDAFEDDDFEDNSPAETD